MYIKRIFWFAVFYFHIRGSLFRTYVVCSSDISSWCGKWIDWSFGFVLSHLNSHIIAVYRTFVGDFFCGEIIMLALEQGMNALLNYILAMAVMGKLMDRFAFDPSVGYVVCTKLKSSLVCAAGSTLLLAWPLCLATQIVSLEELISLRKEERKEERRKFRRP